MCDCYSVINPSSTVCVSITDPGMTLKHRHLTVCGRVATYEYLRMSESTNEDAMVRFAIAVVEVFGP